MQREGRILKLLSGAMMLALGTLLLVAPHLLSHLFIAAGILLGAILVTLLIVIIEKRVRIRVAT
jgi:hypothetical protein